MKRIQQFFKQDIWTINEQTLPTPQRYGIRALRDIILTVNCWIENKLASFTSSLAFSCIFAAVPVLSIILAISRGFGFGDFIEERLRQNVQISGEMGDALFVFIDHYLERTRGGVFLGFGVLLLLYTVVMLTFNIDSAFNEIWHVRSTRNRYRKIVNYISVFLCLPLLIVITSGFSVFMMTIMDDLTDYQVISHTMDFVIRITPLILSAISFICLYKVLPNTLVKWKSVIFPGILAGMLFQLLQYMYIHYQLLLSGYNAIYGSFAALPLFMMWLQFSWYICLFCAQLSHVIQRGDEYIFTKNAQRLSRNTHDSLCILLMTRICKRFAQGEKPYCTHTLSHDTRLPHSIVQGLMEEMVASKLLFEARNESDTITHYLPAIDINQMTADYIVRHLDANGYGVLSERWMKQTEEWEGIAEIRLTNGMERGDVPVKEL